MNTTTTNEKNQSKRKKQHPGELKKEVKRITNSRDNLKEKNKDKSSTIKQLRGALDDTCNSRDAWRKKAEQKQREINELNTKTEQYINEQIKNDETIASLLEEIIKKTSHY